MTYSKKIFSMKNFVLAVAAVLSLASCQEDEIESVSQNAEVAQAKASGPNVESLTITGANTNFSESVDCSTCTYVVAAKSTVIDGKELGLAPGSVICLDKAIKYGNL